MNDSRRAASRIEALQGWDQFWFQPAPVFRIAAIRGLLCAITAVYFASCWSDARFWYGDDGPLESSRVATFLQTSGLEDAGRWIVSPLFLTDSIAVYQAWLLTGIIVAVLVAAGRGGRLAAWALWLLLVGWANRSMIVSGLAETLLSLALLATAIAPPASSWGKANASPHWSAGFAQKLLAMQITIIGAATFVTMLAGRVWINGLGAYALAAPAQDRWIDWTAEGSILVNPYVHEMMTHALVLLLPLGFALAWMRKTNVIGQSLLVLWCVAVSLLGSHWLYASTFAAMVMGIGSPNQEQGE